ncbi:MAG: ribonuclease HII [Treponema sp.]|jgi:ribonuclease HII|nr:ribonuclease HII [Treponema sp.]
MICGIDEAGRGPLAGPVCAAAVALPDDFPFEILGDSKKLSSRARETARGIICEKATAWGVGWAYAAEIDRINILQASLLAMKRAYEDLLERSKKTGQETRNYTAVIDGLYAPDIPAPCTPLVKADSIVPEVMAASILAKTSRDRMMDFYALFYPQYGYEKHKGYPTKAHRAAILKYGPSPIQRMSFSVKGV